MSYEPTVWKSGDVVTSAKLNKLEQGVAGGGSGGDNFRVTFTYNEDTWVCDKTLQEICEAEETGKIIYFNLDSQYYSKLYTTTYLLASYDDGGTTKYAVEVFFIFVDENDDYKTKLLEVTYTVNGINVADRPLGA